MTFDEGRVQGFKEAIEVVRYELGLLNLPDGPADIDKTYKAVRNKVVDLLFKLQSKMAPEKAEIEEANLCNQEFRGGKMK